MNINAGIQRYFNYQSWTLSRHYYEAGAVKKVKIDYDPIRDVYEISAKVEVRSESYSVNLELKRSGDFPVFRCICRNSMANRVACPHIGAVMFLLRELNPSHFPYEFDYEVEHERLVRARKLKFFLDDTGSLIQGYKREVEKQLKMEEEQTDISLISNIEIDLNELVIDFRIGKTKKYVVKNCRQLIDNIDNNTYVEYGKELGFTHNENMFDEVSKKTVSFIRKLVYRSEGTALKSLRVNEQSIDDLFDLYYGSDEYTNWNFDYCDDPLIKLNMSKDSDLNIFKLNTGNRKILVGMEYGYILERNSLYRCSKQFSKNCLSLLRYFIKDEQLVVDQAHLPEFNKYILSSVLPYIPIEKGDFEFVLPERYTCEVYVDMAENGDILIQGYAVNSENQKQSLIHQDYFQDPIVDKVKETLEGCLDEFDVDRQIGLIQREIPISYFLEKILPYLQKLCTVYVSDSIKGIRNPKPVTMQVGIRLSNGLLEVEVSSVDIPQEEISEVLRSYRRKKKYYRLRSGDTISLESEGIQEVSSFLTELNVSLSENAEFTVDNSRMFLLDQAEKDFKSVRFERNQMFKELIEDMKNVQKKNYTVPECLSSVLRDYQTVGFKWLKTMKDYHLGGILADDMGLGKTIQVIALLEDDKKTSGHLCSIVITPASLILNWKDEIEKFSKNLKCLCIQGGLASREYLISEASQYDVIVTSYDYLRKDFELYSDMTFENIILDEAQYIKNHTTKNAHAVKTLKGLNRIALTGTPIENSLAELWSIFDFLMPNYLYNYHYFREEFERPIIREQDEKVQEKLRKIVEPFILRRNKKDVLKELPDKIEQEILLEFNEEEKKVYIANLSLINKELQMKLNTEALDRFQVLAMMTRLRQICCDRRLVYENVEGLSSKLEGCLDLIRSAKDSHKKVLLFSAFTSCLDLVEQELIKEGITYYKLIGSTSKETRHKMVESFQTDDVDVFLISLKAGGTGLNLTAAEIVIHFDPWWNMSAQNQATDRAYRIGQMKNVQVFKLIMKDSIEEKIMELQRRKMNLADAFVSGNEGSITSMSTEEIMDLFTIG